jgi:hypothetical protein
MLGIDLLCALNVTQPKTRVMPLLGNDVGKHGAETATTEYSYFPGLRHDRYEFVLMSDSTSRINGRHIAMAVLDWRRL